MNFLKEYRLYRRDENGKIMKENDHLMDAMRYYIVSGIEVSRQPPAWKDKITGDKKPTFIIPDYNPLDDKYIMV